MTDRQITRTYKYRAIAPIEGVDIFDEIQGLRRGMWADLCKMQEEIKTRLQPINKTKPADRTPEQVEQLAQIRAYKTETIKALRRHWSQKGLSWGDYNAVVFTNDGATKACAKKGVTPAPSDRSLGDAVVRQIQGGCPPHHLMSRNDICLEPGEPDKREENRTPGSHRSKYQRMKMTYMARTDRHPKGAAHIVIEFIKHRPLPPKSSVCEVRILRTKRPIIRKDGSAGFKTYWWVTFVVKANVKARAGGHAVGVCLDWRGDEDGAGLAVVCGPAGLRRLSVSHDHIDEWTSLRSRKKDAESEAHEETRQAMLAGINVAYRRLAARRVLMLRTLAKQIAKDADCVCVDNTVLVGKGVKAYTAPALLRLELRRACENAGCQFVTAKANRKDGVENAARALRKIALEAISTRRDSGVSIAAE